MPRGGGVKEKANKWKALPPRGVIGQLCGKLLLPEERKQWKQAAALLVGLKIRKGLAAEDLTSEVDWLLHRSSISRTCEDCGLKAPGPPRRSGPEPLSRVYY
jgi:hypothetical protein